jgi:hypothetical protein
VSTENEPEGSECHLIVDGTDGGGGSVAGASTDRASVWTTGAKLGGIRKCRYPSLSGCDQGMQVMAGEKTCIPTTK